MTSTEMKIMIEEYRVSCNLLTERIEEINKRLKTNVTEEEYKTLSVRRRTLREERLDVLNIMRNMLEYCQ